MSDCRKILAVFIGAVVLLCSGCSGLRSYSHPAFAVERRHIRIVTILPPLIDVQLESYDGGRSPLQSLEASLQLQSRDELERVFKEHGYTIRAWAYTEQELAAQPQLRNDVRAVIWRYADIAYDLQRESKWGRLGFYVGTEALGVASFMGSDALVLMKCKGVHYSPGATVRDALWYGVQDALLSNNVGFGSLHKSKVIVQIGLVRPSDGAVIWYGDNLTGQDMNIADEKQFRNTIRRIVKQLK